MLSWADVDWLRAAAYLAVAVLCVVIGRRADPAAPGHWRLFWPVTAALLAAMAIGRSGDVAEWLVNLARDEARDDGWYDARRRLQAAVVGLMAIAWFAVVVTACVRIPERRRRYLATVLAVITLCAFVAVRVVSLHQVDSVLHRRHIAGLRVGTATEYLLTVLVAAAALASERTARGAAYSEPERATPTASE